MSNNYVTNIEKCTGCGSCIQICPVQAINMVYKAPYGTVAKIEKINCINCNLCHKKCPIETPIQKKDGIEQAYVGWSKNISRLGNVSSGGIASEIYQFSFKHNIVAVGVGKLKEELTSIYEFGNEKNIKFFSGSKYIDLNMGYIYTDIKNKLKDNHKVVFIGLPCHCAGLYRYIGDNDNIIYIDLLCKNRPFDNFLLQHIRFLEKKLKIKINSDDISFRDGIKYGLKIRKDKLLYNRTDFDNYHLAFHLGIISRESCLNCQFKNKHRITDISLGDYHIVHNGKSYEDKSKQKSLVVVNSNKGKNFIESLDSIYLEKINYDEQVKKSSALNEDNNSYENVHGRKLFLWLYKHGFGFENSMNISSVYFRIKVLLKMVIKGIRRMIYG